jgi:hypothetical protein
MQEGRATHLEVMGWFWGVGQVDQHTYRNGTGWRVGRVWGLERPSRGVWREGGMRHFAECHTEIASQGRTAVQGHNAHMLYSAQRDRMRKGARRRKVTTMRMQRLYSAQRDRMRKRAHSGAMSCWSRGRTAAQRDRMRKRAHSGAT